MFCPKCGKEIADGVTFCPECGTKNSDVAPKIADTQSGTRDSVSQTEYVYPKNPPLSPYFAFVGLLIGGLGHIIFGQVTKGIVIMVAFLVCIPTGILALLINVGAVIDAYMVGKTLEAGKPVKKWQFFPKP
jgi:hypothetical protein